MHSLERNSFLAMTLKEFFDILMPTFVAFFACVQTYILICKISHFALSSGTTNSYKNSGWYWLIIHNSSRSRSDRRVAESHKISAKMKGFVAVFSGILASGSVSGAPQNYVMSSCTSNCNIQDLSNLKHNQVFILNKCSVL